MLRSHSRALLILFFCLCLSIGTMSAGSAFAAEALSSNIPHATASVSTQNDWPSVGYDAGNSRDNVLENTLGPDNVSNLVLDWSAHTGSVIAGSAVEANGIVYVGSADNHLYAFDASTGAPIWSYNTGSGGSPAVANGAVYYGAGFNLYAFNATTGALLWQVAANVDSIQVVNNVIYVTSRTTSSSSQTTTYNLSALDAATGAQIWSTSVLSAPFSSPGGCCGSIAVANGIVYIGAGNSDPVSGNLYAFNASTGSQLWSAPIGGPVAYPTVVNGVVYIGSANHHLYAFNASTGAQLWSAPTSGSVVGSLAVTNGTVYTGSTSYTSSGTPIASNLSAFNTSTGAQLWNTSIGIITASSPGVANGVVYIGSANHSLYAFDAGTGTQLWSAPLGGIVYGSPTIANGVVYIGSRNGYLYAFNLSAPPSANTNWYFAEGSVGGEFTEYLTLLNPSGAHGAHVSVQYLFENQAAVTKSYTVMPSTRYTVNVNNELGVTPTAPQQAISAIVTSDAPIVAERPMYFVRQSDLGDGGTDVVGATSTTHTSFYFANGDSAQTSDDTSNEYITILNPSTTQTANITANYYSAGNVVGTQTISVQPLHRGTIIVAEAYKGQEAIKVTSDIGVVVERPVYSKVNVPTAGGIISGSASTLAATVPGDSWLFAEGHTADQFQENLALANFGASATTATINLEYTNGTVQSVPVTINGQSQYFFDVNNAFLHPLSGCGCTPTADVSVEVTSAAPIVAERVMFFNYHTSVQGWTVAGMTDVVGEPGPSAHSDYSFAEGFTYSFANGDQYSHFEEWLTLQNPNANAEVAAVTLFFDGTLVQQRVNLPAHSRTTLNIDNIVDPIANNLVLTDGANAYEVSMDVRIVGNGTIVAERPMYFDYQDGTPSGNSIGGTDVIGYTGN